MILLFVGDKPVITGTCYRQENILMVPTNVNGHEDQHEFVIQDRITLKDGSIIYETSYVSSDTAKNSDEAYEAIYQYNKLLQRNLRYLLYPAARVCELDL